MKTETIKLVFDGDDLGDIELIYVCESCGDQASVDPTFFEQSGTPICGNYDCKGEGDDMTILCVRIEHHD